MSNAVGEDRSSFQRVGSWGGNMFAFAKATEGNSWSDPTFASNWANAAKEGKVRGAYHFFHPADSPSAQAAFFMSVVKAHGLHAGDVLVADVEISAGADGMEGHGTERASSRAHTELRELPRGFTAAGVGAGALQFLQEVQALAGPRCKVMLYSSLFMAQNLLTQCSAYPLWLAYYAGRSPSSVAPWRSWTFWQNGATGLGGGDFDYFNGTEAALVQWANPSPAPLPPDWTYPPVRSLTAGGGNTSVKLEWTAPAPVPNQQPMPGIAEYEVAIVKGASLDGPQVASYPRFLAKGANPEVWQGGSLARKTQYTAGVRAIAPDGGHAGGWATATFSTT
jgi:GH25 family lysozyme M1 (1,4-beta-N-acetylmuramidase)